MTPSPRPQLPPILRFLRAVPLHVLVAQIILSCAALSLALPVCAQKDDSTGRQAAAQAQFARAQALRATLEAKPEPRVARPRPEPAPVETPETADVASGGA